MAEHLLSTGHQHKKLPESYVRPETDRPGLTEVLIDHNIPIIDLSLADESQIVSQIAHACQSYGFFQVVNHGMSDELMQQMMAVASEFFSLPAEEKMSHYSDDPAKKMRLSTSFNVKKEKIHNWRDYLRLHCHPLEEFVPDWPSNPSSSRMW
ncbi:protein DOWNY MILDEW RESISTANCE 6 [Iris pallida]|uniref:Protein DOWNY MILDEW RESISTANCE 6 n=1 Tax=Iris pallida TaxID=29817 RepID=A0AAX6E923_IRIPA|nr:protein DOWNY MILDEW RESISTANCE 6 [Iris pallida]